MPGTRDKGPQPACVEDYDDDKHTVLSATRVHARAGKDGSDSGYSSRTGTVDGEHGEPGPMADSRSRAVPLERERMPYGGVPAGRRRESVCQPKPVPAKAPKEAQPVKEAKKFVHAPGLCWTCDQYGYHVTQEKLDEIKQSLKGGKPSTTDKPKTTKEAPAIQSKDRDDDPKLRRMSSRRNSRPFVQCPPTAMQPIPATYATSPGYYNTAGYATSAGYPPQPSPAYTTYPQTPATPITTSYLAQPTQEYFDQYGPEVVNTRSSQRASIHDDFNFRHPQYEQYDSSHPQRETTYARDILPSTRDARPQIPRHASSRSIDPDAYHQDRHRMPPPALPLDRSQHTRRPSVKKSHTYDDPRAGRPDPRNVSRESDEEAWGRARYTEHTDYDPRSNRQSLSVRTRDLTLPASSTSNRDYVEESPVRPPARKSVSYSYPREVETVAKSSAARDTTHRRVTTPVTPMDAKVAEAEAYQQKRSSMASDDFPAEKMKSLKSSKAPTRSDAGSNYSHRESHYSSSKDSTSKKARRDSSSIVIETGSKNRPLSIQMPGGLTVQIGPEQEKEKEKEKRKEQKLLEGASASASGMSQTSASRSRAATSSYTSSERGRDRDYQEKVSKRSSHVIETRPPPSPVKTATKSSRAPSRSRASSDADGSRRRRQSVVSERIVLKN